MMNELCILIETKEISGMGDKISMAGAATFTIVKESAGYGLAMEKGHIACFIFIC